jgi:hypothetical protein
VTVGRREVPGYEDHEIDVGQIPTGVADLDLREMAVAVWHLEATTVDDDGAVALPLRARVGPGECAAQGVAVGAGPHDVGSCQEACDRGLAGLGMDLTVVLELDPSEGCFVQEGESEIGHVLEHRHQPAFDRAPEGLDLPIGRWRIRKRCLVQDAETS